MKKENFEVQASLVIMRGGLAEIRQINLMVKATFVGAVPDFIRLCGVMYGFWTKGYNPVRYEQ